MHFAVMNDNKSCKRFTLFFFIFEQKNIFLSDDSNFTTQNMYIFSISCSQTECCSVIKFVKIMKDITIEYDNFSECHTFLPLQKKKTYSRI